MDLIREVYTYFNTGIRGFTIKLTEIVIPGRSSRQVTELGVNDVRVSGRRKY